MEKISTYKIRRNVDFSETDMAGIVHFSNFFRWMEAAEAAFFKELGIALINTDGEDITGWPRVRADCAYHAPLTFGDEVEVCLSIKALKIRAIEYGFTFMKTSDGQTEKVATGKMTTVFAKRPKSGGEMSAASIPESLLARIEEAE